MPSACGGLARGSIESYKLSRFVCVYLLISIKLKKKKSTTKVADFADVAAIAVAVAVAGLVAAAVAGFVAAAVGGFVVAAGFVAVAAVEIGQRFDTAASGQASAGVVVRTDGAGGAEAATVADAAAVAVAAHFD